MDDSADCTIDASGALVAPGFIDVHTHLDPSLFWDGLYDPLPQHGVTCADIGNCSLSLAPLRSGQRESVSQLFSYVDDIPTGAFRDIVPWSWESFPTYRREVDFGTALNTGLARRPLAPSHLCAG